MKSLFLIVVTVLVFGSLSYADDSAPDSWSGIYDFSAAGGRDAGGVAVFLQITLKISPNGLCTIHREGYQMLDSIRCTTSIKSKGIDVLFKSYSGGKLENKYGLIVHKQGERLFSLYPASSGKGLITDWGTLKPKGYVVKQRGIYFRKLKER